MSKQIEEGVAFPEVNLYGLSDQAVKDQVAAGEINKTDNGVSRTMGQIIRSNVFTLFNGIILAAMVVVLLTGQWKDAVFGFIIIINTGIGVVTELKAKRTLDRLSILVASNYYVHRNGRNIQVSHDQIVTGDLLWIRSGDQVPADAKIEQTWGLELNESMLTGESRTVHKRQGEEVFSGSTAVSGLALVTVTAVGSASYAAKLTAQAKVYKKVHSDINESINKILKVMTFVVVPLCVLLIWSQLRTVGGLQNAISDGSWRGAVVAAVAGVVGMIPEGLVLLTSLNFALAAMRLAKENTLVQQMESVETLARVDALNLDKTGTITDGGIVFDSVVGVSDRPNEHIKQAVVDVCNEEDPNETAQAILKGLQTVHPSTQVSVRIPFSSGRKWSAITREDGSTWYFGAPEVLLSAQTNRIELVEKQVADMAYKGNRVLLLASCVSGLQDEENPEIPSNLYPEALVTCSEHIRDDAETTLAWFREQGVRCRVISGDNPKTVAAIARSVRLTGDHEPRYMDARELPSDVNQLADVLQDVDVLGRVLPEQKKAIVDALHVQGHTVAMTGDGVNDSLALKEADLGIAMGNAAPATKAVAQVVLVDSKFSHLPDVVARGRQVMANMERVAGLFLVKTVYSVLISIGVVLSAIPFPYLPRHITYIGALTIGTPAFFLALAPNTRRYKPGFLKRVMAFAVPGGVAIAVMVLGIAWFAPVVMHWDISDPSQLAQLRTMCAIVLFAMAILVLARVATPLNSWRGILVLVFGIAGIVGAFIPFVAHFFAIILPTGRAAVVTLVGVLIGLVAMMLSVTFLSKVVDRSRQ